MGMAAFAYGVKNKKILLAALSSAPVLLHFFIGSRAYMVVLILIIVIYYSQSIGRSLIRHWWIILVGGLGGIFILAYKKMYELIKVSDFAGAFKVLIDPETYAFISRMGEPRIVLANLNYIIDKHITLDWGDVWDRIISIIPFANNFVATNYTPVSTILREGMSSSYGLASNIWGEYYAIGSYLLVLAMFLIWLKMMSWGNRLLKRTDYSLFFIVPPLLYTAFYIHRQDFVKIIGCYKASLLGLLIFMFLAIVLGRKRLKISYRSAKKY